MNTGKIERIGYPTLVKFDDNSKNRQNQNKEKNENNKKDKEQKEEVVEIPDEFRGKNFDVKL